MASFDIAFALYLSVEQGYVYDPDDAGGETKYGISKTRFPELDIKNLTVEKASALVKEHYWELYRIDEIADQELANQLLLAFTNLPPDSAARCIQRAINRCGGRVLIDGVMGSKTINAMKGVLIDWLSDRFRFELVLYYAKCAKVDKTKLKFLSGWIWRASL